jgi:hypothetical protein
MRVKRELVGRQKFWSTFVRHTQYSISGYDKPVQKSAR